MKVSPINNNQVAAKALRLKRINPESIKSLDAIKKIADENCMDLTITRGLCSDISPEKEVYSVLCLNQLGKKQGDKLLLGTSYTSVEKPVDSKKLSVKIYNAAMEAIENLNSKIKAFA